MTKARDISDLLDATGDVKSTALDNIPPSNDASALTTGTIDNARISLDANEIPSLDTAKITTGTFADARMPSTVLNSNVDLTNLSASNLTSGTLPDARFPSTLPAVSGANLTNLPGGGKVLQVLQTVKTDTFTTSTAMSSFADITGMSQTITPSATSSKILVTVCGHCTNQTSNYQNSFRLVRDSTSIFIGDSRGSTTRSSSGGTISNGNMENFSITFLDSPNTTSSVTYKLQGASESGGTLYFGGTYLSHSSAYQSSPASITVMEIGA